MNQKELGELRRRFRPDRSAVSRVYGCYVNSGREIISYLDESLGQMPQEEAEKYLGLLKKALSGTLGKNLIDIVFSTEQVMNGPEHRLLSQLRSSALKDGAARDAFYQKVIESLDMGESNYLILLAHDAYDVPHRGKDGEAPPERGFLFPAFDDRAANIYNALFYSRKADELHQELIDAVFHTEPPMSPAEQKEAFQSALCDSLEDCCNVEVVQGVYERLREAIEQHKESKNPEPLALTVGEISSILREIIRRRRCTESRQPH